MKGNGNILYPSRARAHTHTQIYNSRTLFGAQRELYISLLRHMGKKVRNPGLSHTSQYRTQPAMRANLWWHGEIKKSRNLI
jgi:hypothetical protein